MKRLDVKSRCPINYTIEIFGDPWSLLIVREMAALGKKTFSEFLDTEERIGTSVLSDRLLHLEKKGIIQKRSDPTDNRKNVYTLTPRGMDALPILYEVGVWGSYNSNNPKAHETWFKAIKLDRSTVLAAWRRSLEMNSSFFMGENSAIKQLGLTP